MDGSSSISWYLFSSFVKRRIHFSTVTLGDAHPFFPQNTIYSLVFMTEHHRDLVLRLSEHTPLLRRAVVDLS